MIVLQKPLYSEGKIFFLPFLFHVDPPFVVYSTSFIGDDWSDDRRHPFFGISGTEDPPIPVYI